MKEKKIRGKGELQPSAYPSLLEEKRRRKKGKKEAKKEGGKGGRKEERNRLKKIVRSTIKLLSFLLPILHSYFIS